MPDKLRGGRKIKSPAGRILIISDVHGCSATLKHLLKQVKPNEDDHVIFLGDLVNKGPDSIGVLKQVRDLKKKVPVTILRGNHEQVLLENNRKKQNQLITSCSFYASLDLLDRNLKLQDWIKELFEDSVYYVKIPGAWVSHAGFDFSKEKPLDASEAMMYIRDFQTFGKKKKKKIIHGHNPKQMDYIQKCLDGGCQIIPLDNGCVYPNRKDMGNLLALDYTNWKLYKQLNAEHDD